MSMNKLSERLIIGILFLLLFIAYGIAGAEDYNQEVIDSMPDEAYYEIVQKLGQECSNSDIVREYKTNREYYDSFGAIWD